MANGRPPGDDFGRPSRRPRGGGANEEGLSALGREMHSGDPEKVANEEGLKALGARIDASGSPKLRRSGKPKWSAGKKTVVILTSVVVLAAAAIGGGYAYLWYRFNQLSKVHIADEVTAAGGQPFTMLVIGSDSHHDRGAMARLGVEAMSA